MQKEFLQYHGTLQSKDGWAVAEIIVLLFRCSIHDLVGKFERQILVLITLISNLLSSKATALDISSVNRAISKGMNAGVWNGNRLNFCTFFLTYIFVEL